MSFLLPPAQAKAQAPLGPQARWITPEEQLVQLGQLKPSIVKEIVGATSLIKDVSEIVAEYAAESRLTNWYTALKLIGKLPKKIPPLPRQIHKVLNSKCPKIICDKLKSDGTFYTVGEKCTLTLIPEELENINQFERVVKSYGEKQYPENENPLQFRYFWDAAREEHGSVPFGPTHWELQTDGVLEGSRNKVYREQEKLVASLAKETFADWKVPDLPGTIVATFLKKIGTGESLYPAGNDQNGNVSTYTRLQEKTQNLRLAVGCFYHSGVFVNQPPHLQHMESMGVAAQLKF